MIGLDKHDHVEVDVLVAGAGPVGLAVGVEAALRGLRVAVTDPRPGPVDKACGEGLMPSARAALRRLGVDPSGYPLAGIRYLSPRAESSALFRTGPGLGVRRTTLTAALEARAQQLGVLRVHAAVDADEVVRSGWTTDAAPRPTAVAWRSGTGAPVVRARWLVAADGLHSPLRRAAGLDAPARGPARFGLRRHFRVSPWSDLVEVHWSRDAEAYVTPVSADLVGVAVLGGAGRGFEEAFAAFAALTKRLRDAPAVGVVRGAGPLRQVARRRVAGRVLLAGDAAGYVDALTGEGIAVGLASARLLVDALVEGRPEGYDAAWRRASRRYRTMTTALVVSSRRPAVRRRIVPAAAALPGVFAAVVDQLA